MNVYFEIKSFLDKVIRTTETHWQMIVNIKHPEISGKEVEVKKCLTDPVEIRISAEDHDVYLYYMPLDKYFICVVARHLNGDGFIITSYITDKIKEGKIIWKR